MTVLRIEFDDDGSEELLLVDGAIINEYSKQSHASVEVFRDSWLDVVGDIDEINDEFYLNSDGSDVFGGRLVSTSNEESTVLLEIGSFEEDALDARPTGNTETFIDDDSVIVNDAIDRIPTLSAGSVDSFGGEIDIIFSNTSPAGMIREVQRTTRGIVRYNADKSIDYVDKANEGFVTTVGPQTANVQDDFNVIEDEREEYTHIRVLGASEGLARVSAQEVTLNYDGGREVWRKYSDKSITSENRARKIATEIADEMDNNPRRLKVETTIFGLDVEVGDRLKVVSRKDNIDNVLWVVKTRNRLEGGQDVLEVVLSNRLLLDESQDEKRRRDVERYNEGFQGDVVTINSGGYRAPIDDGQSYVFSLRKPPDVVQELKAELQVSSLPFRSYEEPISEQSDFPTNIDILVNRNTVDSLVTDELLIDGEGRIFQESDHLFEADFLGNTRNDAYSYEIDADIGLAGLVVSDDPVIDETIFGYRTEHTFSETELESINEIQADCIYYEGDVDNPENVFLFVGHSDGENFEIIEEDEDGFEENKEVSFTFDPSNIDLLSSSDYLIVGVSAFHETNSEQEVSVGFQDLKMPENDGYNFDRVVDISSRLDEGFNRIEVTSDSLGHLRATAFLDVYRQIV